MIYYNDNDHTAVAWLRELAAQGAIGQGVIDERSIQDVLSTDVAGFERCHFFAGIGGWQLACELAGWDGPIWTASLPCQPFSHAGKQLGVDDHRHLWPVFHDLVAEHLPPVIVGEQVASKAGREWLAAVRADLEALGYAVGAADLSASSVGAPHIRQRLYWCAIKLGYTSSERRQQVARGAFGDEETHGRVRRDRGEPDGDHIAAGSGKDGADWLADTDWARFNQFAETGLRERRQPKASEKTDARDLDGARREYADRCGDPDRLPNSGSTVLEGHTGDGNDSTKPEWYDAEPPGPASPGSWTDVVYVPCADGKWRPLPRRVEHSGRRNSEEEPKGNDVFDQQWSAQRGRELVTAGAGTRSRVVCGDSAEGTGGPDDGANQAASRNSRRVADTISDEEHKKFEKSATHENKRSSNGFGGCRMDSERITTTRPTEPGPLPLADGLSPLLVRGCGEGVPADQIDPDATAEGRVMRLKGYGNAIVPELAATFIRSVMDVLLDCQEETER